MSSTEDWQFESINVPSDGSCFFTSVSIAMNDSVDEWMMCPRIKDIMMHHWERFNRLKIEETSVITPKFIRYMSASSMNDGYLEIHNAEASIMNEKIFKTPEELARHVLHSECWANHAMMFTFMKSIENRISLVVFDILAGGTVYMPKEMTYKKKLYICLELKNNHYTPMRISYKGVAMKLCICRPVIRHMMSECNEEGDIDIY